MLNLSTLNEQEAARLTNERFHLILFATEKCNFRCVYCYEDFALGKMGSDVISGVRNLLDKRMPQLSYLKLSWFGGEPLLALDVIREIHKHIRRSPYYGNLKVFYSDITTNGFLLSESHFSELIDLGVVFFQISLDGDAEFHNSTRLSLSGSGTFGKIYSNILKMKQSPAFFDAVLRVHITHDNLDSVKRLIAQLSIDIGDDQRFKLHFKPVNHLGGPNDQTIKILKGAERDSVPKELASLYPYPARIYDLSQGGQYICYAAAANSIAIRSDGAIAKCTVALSDDFNRIGKLGADGSITVDDIKYQRWISALLSGEKAVQACPVHFVRGLDDRD